jgi:hypothetical protein
MAPPTAFTFTDNLSTAVNFAGVVKIKVDGLTAGNSVWLLEEKCDGNYETRENQWYTIKFDTISRTFELYGNYKVQRSNSGISVGYVAA